MIARDALRANAAPLQPRDGQDERARLLRKVRLLAWAAIGWHVAEFAIALGAGLAAGSIALVGFGVDSAIEAAAGLVVVWLVASRRSASAAAERRAQKLIAASSSCSPPTSAPTPSRPSRRAASRASAGPASRWRPSRRPRCRCSRG